MYTLIKLNVNKMYLLMAERNMTPFTLAEKAGIHYNSYLRITRGYSIRPLTAGKIARALDVKVEDLLKGEE